MTTQETILKLRDRAGWWCGDTVAAKVLEEFVQQITAERDEAIALRRRDYAMHAESVAALERELEGLRAIRKIPASRGVQEL